MERAILADKQKKKREFHYATMLQVAVVYLYALCDSEGDTTNPGMELCYNEGSSDLTEWEDAMSKRTISFTIWNKKYLYLARTFFHGLWERNLWFDESFTEELMDAGDEEEYEELKAQVMNPPSHPGGIEAIIGSLAEANKHELEQWEAPPLLNPHPYKGCRTYTFRDLLKWAEYDLAELQRKYPELA